MAGMAVSFFSFSPVPFSVSFSFFSFSPVPFSVSFSFVLRVWETSQFIHSFLSFFFLLSAGTKGSGWELPHLTGSPGGGGALDSVIL